MTTKTNNQPRAKRRNGLYVACHPNGKPFFFHNYSTCKRLTRKRGFVRPANEDEKTAASRISREEADELHAALRARLDKPHTRLIRHLGACEEAVVWADTHPDMHAAWAACPRGDWMLWLLGRLAAREPADSDARRTLVRIAARVAREALPHLAGRRLLDDPRLRECLDACESWARGGCSIEELRLRRDAAYAAAPYVAVTAAGYVVDATPSAVAVVAAQTAVAAAADAAAAVYATTTVVEAATVRAKAEAARSEMLRRCADIVRELHPEPPALDHELV